MDDLYALAETWEPLPSDSVLATTADPVYAYLSDTQALHAEGDKALIEQLINLLNTPPGAQLPPPSQPVPIAEQSMLGRWSGAFSKAINGKTFLAWAEPQGFDFNTLRVLDSRLHVTAHGQPKVFSLADESGWWALANPIIYISRLVDPTALGMPYLGPKSGTETITLALDLTLAFHGYPMPTNRLAAMTIVEELQALQGFPAFDDNGRGKSIIRAELTQQVRDCRQLADTLEPLIRDEQNFFALDIYRTRLHLTSDSRLARSLKEAAALLQAILDENGLGGTVQAPTNAHFDFKRKLICVLANDNGQAESTLVPALPDTRWDRLVLLGEQLGIHLYPAHSVSLVDALQAYAFERPLGREAISALIQRLRDKAVPAQPVILNTTRSFSELQRFRRYVGKLNDRHTLHRVLSQVIDDGNLHGPEGLERVMTADPDALLAVVKGAYSLLHRLTDDPDFLKVRTRERIDPDSHVLLSASGNIGAFGLDGIWKSLSEAVAEHDHLVQLKRALMKVAANTGGQLRTNDIVGLAQALKLYQLPLPSTLEDARTLLQRLEIPLPLPSGPGPYWRALTSVGAQPSAWTLSPFEREQILAISTEFMADRTGTLFGYLCQPLLDGKSAADVRAEADYLMMRLLASPTAQQLGQTLADALHWHGVHAADSSESGSRNALIFAALVLSLDPQCDAQRTGINYLDWHADYYWGESVSWVRNHIETALGGAGEPLAALATHLILSEKSPHLLVRDIPDETPYLSSHTWVLFCQYVMHMEKITPGSSRQLSYAQIMFLAFSPPKGRWKTFLGSPQAAVPILDWAVVNGVLAPRPRYNLQAVNTAIDALNAQRTRLTGSLEAFAKPVVSLRETARDDLRRVYPDNPWLDAPILMWLPDNSPFSEDRHFEGIYTGPQHSFTDLHMADRLDVTSTTWHSSHATVKYQEMAKRFHLLGRIYNVFSQAFDQKLNQLKAAYRESICYWLSQLTLPRREALEYGHIRFFSLSRPGPSPRAPASVGRFGVLLQVTYLSDQHFYECFPRQLLIRPRRDLDARQLKHAVDTGTRQPWMRFDWAAYEHGDWPADLASLEANTDVLIRAFGKDLPEAIEVAPLDAQGRRVPRTLDSPRSHALAQTLLSHLLEDGLALREKARQPITLEEAVSEHDPWADFLRNMALKSG